MEGQSTQKNEDSKVEVSKLDAPSGDEPSKVSELPLIEDHENNDAKNVEPPKKRNTKSKIEFPKLNNDGDIPKEDERIEQIHKKEMVEINSFANLKRRMSAKKIAEELMLEEVNIFNKFDEEDNSIRKNGGEKLLDHSYMQLFLLIVTFFALFSDDYRILVSPIQVDPIWDAFTIICIVIFIAEIITASIFKAGFLNSYYFYLDIISTLSLILDFSYIRDPLIEFGRSGSSGISRLGKLVRLIRLIRLVRISKIYKSLSNKGDEEDSHHKKKKKNDSKVGRRISELATKAVIIMCFLLLILLPVFNSDFWIQPAIGPEGLGSSYTILMTFTGFTSFADIPNVKFSSADAFNDATNQAKMLAKTTSNYISDFSSNSNGKILKIVFPESSISYYKVSNYDNYRNEEVNSGTGDVGTKGSIVIIQDNTTLTQFEAYLSIVRTFYIGALLLGGSHLFGKNTYNLIISPIDRMIEKVKKVIMKPQKLKDQAFIEDEEKDVEKELKHEQQGSNIIEEEIIEDKDLETFIIEESIKKIGILLAVGLGDAGSSLINSYLGREMDVDILQPGIEIDAIYGFCDIRNFTDATEVLQQEVMVFVNSIADIIHTITDRNGGTANKNIGDAFLLVWKIQNSTKLKAKKQGVTEKEIYTNLADLALFALMKMYAEINRNFGLSKYVNNPGLKERIQNYKVRLGFGLHFGWSIEGAIGSPFKVDASYLSPHVNKAGWLESETKGYGVPMLLSGEFYDILSDYVKEYCRKVDIVQTKGPEDRMRVYAPIISDKAIKFPIFEPLKQHVLKTKEGYTFKKLLRKEIYKGTFVGPPLFQNDPDIPLMTGFINSTMIEKFNIGMEAFERGDWTMAKDYLESALKIDPSDGPSKHIYHYMKDYQFVKPQNWDGARNLGSSSH